MIKEALQYLTDLGRRDVAPLRVITADPRKEHYLVSGQKVPCEVPVPPRSHFVRSLDDLITMAEVICDAEPAAVFFNEAGVILIFDADAHRVERATFRLEFADSWRVIADYLAKGPWLDAKLLIRMLRTELYGCLPDSALADIIRRIKFESGQIVTAETSRNRESLGREITAKVTAVAEVPDRVVLSTPVYSSLGETDCYPLACSVEVDPMRGEPFQLKPLPDEIERVQQLAMTSIRKRLQAGLPEDMPCFYGNP